MEINVPAPSSFLWKEKNVALVSLSLGKKVRKAVSASGLFLSAVYRKG